MTVPSTMAPGTGTTGPARSYVEMDGMWSYTSTEGLPVVGGNTAAGFDVDSALERRQTYRLQSSSSSSSSRSSSPSSSSSPRAAEGGSDTDEGFFGDYSARRRGTGASHTTSTYAATSNGGSAVVGNRIGRTGTSSPAKSPMAPGLSHVVGSHGLLSVQHSSSMMPTGANVAVSTPSASDGAAAAYGMYYPGGSPLFTKDDYSVTLATAQIAGRKSVAKANKTVSRSRLQHRIQNYFDSSFSFLLNHDEQTAQLLQRLEMVSKLDEEAQMASVSLNVQQWYGTANTQMPQPAPSTASARASELRSAANGHGGERAISHPAAAVGAATTMTTTAAVSTAHPGTPPSPSPAAGVTPSPIVTVFSQFTVADDIVRKFFTSLTKEFLTPVTAWFTAVTAPYTAFHLCDQSTSETLLDHHTFLDYLRQRHRDIAPSMWTRHHHYKTYKSVYERFARGSLFKAYMQQLVDRKLRKELDDFQVDEWATAFPAQPERIDMFINLFSVVQRELTQSIDPDVLFVTTATSVLASMAVSINEPLRDQFMLKIEELKL